jgi:hypothetical protein
MNRGGGARSGKSETDEQTQRKRKNCLILTAEKGHYKRCLSVSLLGLLYLYKHTRVTLLVKKKRKCYMCIIRFLGYSGGGGGVEEQTDERMDESVFTLGRFSLFFCV